MLFNYNISMKKRIIILIVACMVGVGIVVNEGYKNYTEFKNKADTSIVKSSITDNKIDQVAAENKSDEEIAQDKILSDQIKSKDELQKQADEKRKDDEKKQAEASKAKVLDDKIEQGHIAFNAKKYREAIAIEDEVINQNSSLYKAYNVKGIALCYSHNFKEGMQDIDKSLEINPDFGYARFNKALGYELYGYYDDSIIWYNKALEVEKYIWSYYGISSIYGRRGDAPSTVKYLKLALSMDSSIKAIVAEEHDFDPVKDSPEFQTLLK